MSLQGYEPFKSESPLPTDHFLCLLAADFTKASDAEISVLANSLLESGASYFVCWGPGCERAHDLIDDLTLLIEPPIPDDSVVMATWHDNQNLAEALHFLLCEAWPDTAYEDSTGCILAVSVNNSSIAAEIRTALSKPESFLARFI